MTTTTIIIPVQDQGPQSFSERYKAPNGLELTVEVHSSNRYESERLLSGIMESHGLVKVKTPSRPFLEGFLVGLGLCFVAAILAFLGAPLSQMAGFLSFREVETVFMWIARLGLVGTIPVALLCGLVSMAFSKR